MVVLLEADIGIKTAQKIVDEVESRAMDQKLKSFDEISECLIEVMHELYASVEDEDFHKNEDGPIGHFDGRRQRQRENDNDGKADKAVSIRGQQRCTCGSGYLPCRRD